MEALTKVRMVVEVMTDAGPTGDFAEVLEVRVEDYGGNIHWSGPVESYHPKRCGVTGPVPKRIIATRLGKLSGCIADFRADC